MLNDELHELGAAILKRNPLLSQRLRPGLAATELEAAFRRAKMVGSSEPIKALYSWRNGTTLDQALMTSKTGFFPGQPYQFSDLSKAIEHMKAYSDCICGAFPELAHLRGRFFPAFWNGSTNWIALDLNSKKGRVVLVRYFVQEASISGGQYTAEIYEKTPPREAYGSFEDFVSDAIRANKENVPLMCFQER